MLPPSKQIPQHTHTHTPTSKNSLALHTNKQKSLLTTNSSIRWMLCAYHLPSSFVKSGVLLDYMGWPLAHSHTHTHARVHPGLVTILSSSIIVTIVGWVAESPIGRYRLLSESDIDTVYSHDSHSNSLIQA